MNSELEKQFQYYFNTKLIVWKDVTLKVDSKKSYEICRICEQQVPMNEFILHVNYCKEQKIFYTQMKIIKSCLMKLISTLEFFRDTINIYNSNNFIIFRYLFRKLYKFLNLKFYVMIDDYKIKELNLKENNFFCIQRKNFLNENFDKKTELKINNQTFFITNLTNELNIKNYKDNFLKILTNKLNMFYFIQNENNITKNIIENLNLLLKKKNYIYIQSNFYYQKNQIKKFYEELKKNNLNSLIILNHNYNYKQNDIEIIQTFKDKYFNLKEYTLKNVNMNNINEHYKYFSYNILKKKFLDINNLQFYNDIKFEENSLFTKKI
jgi:hypothetical protein